MDGSFGSRLRSQREQQQIPLSVIAERTKIKGSLLEALERDDVSQWPAGIFRRSFIRAYAQAIGLDGDAVLREFLELYPDPVEEENAAAALAAARENRRPPTRLGYLISSAIGALPVLVSGARGRSGGAAAPGVVDAPAAPSVGREAADVAPDLPDLEHTAGGSLFGDEKETPLVPVSCNEAVDRVEPEDLPGLAPELMLAQEPFESQPGGLVHAAEEHPQLHNPASTARTPCFSEIADLCTRLARAMQPRDVVPVLEDAARVLDAVGLIVWMWDPATRTLGHVLAHGYSSDVLARLPRVRWDTDNAIAEAFRCADTRVVGGNGTSTGAVVVPIVTAGGCAGVLAMELQDRGEERQWVRAVASILAAQLAALFGFQALAEAVGA